MDEANLTDLATEARPIAQAMAPGLSAAFGTFLRSGQDRKNLEADRAVVAEMLQAGKGDFRYRGIAMEFETFANAHQEEIARLVTNTVNAMSKADSTVDWSKVDLDQFSPEFRRRWISEASNVSDETLQDLWARLLAGELESPGSVSNDTMSIARDMTKERAEEFQKLCSAALCDFGGSPLIVVGCGSPGSNSLKPYGLSYEVLTRLVHHRLIVGDMNSYIELEVDSSQVRLFRHQEATWLVNWPANTQLHRISGILFTPAGKELFAVVQKVPNPEYTEAMLKDLGQSGATVVPLADVPYTG